MTIQLSAYDRKVFSFGAQSYFLREAIKAFAGTKPNTFAEGVVAGAGTERFNGLVAIPGNKLLAIPYSNANVGLFDLATGAYTAGPAVSPAGSARFRGGCLHQATGLVVMAPLLSDRIGLYDTASGEYIQGPIVGASPGFCGAVVSSRTGEVILVPGSGANVGIFNPITRKYRPGASHGLATGQFFASAEELPNGLILMVPYSGGRFMLYDPVANTFSNGPTASGSALFFGSVMLHNGDIVCVPYSSATIAIYRWKSNTIYSVACPAGGAKFRYGALTSDGRVVFGAGTYDRIGGYDPSTDAYFEGGALTLGSTVKWNGVAQMSDGRIMLAPYANDKCGLFTATAGPGLPRQVLECSLWNKA